MRRLLAFLVLLVASAASWGQAFSITRTSGNTFYVDLSGSILCSYVSYQVTNTSGVNAPDVWTDITMGAGTISKAANETGYQHLGAIAAGATKATFFYLCSNGTLGTVNETHTVRVLSNAPSLSPTVYTSTGFNIATVVDTINANANKVTVVTSGPNPPTIGGIITITVSGDTGTMGSPPFIYFTPASLSSWPADKIKLISTQITMTGGNNITLNDTLFSTLTGTATSNYTATYTFVAVGTTSLTTAVTPINYIASGAQVKHTDTGGLASLAPVQPVSSSLQVLKLVNNATLPPAGGTVTYTLRIYNNSASSVSLDQMVDTMPSSPAVVSYVLGSSKFNGVAIANPFVSGSTLTWSGTFTVAGGATADLTFNALVPGTAGTYVNRGYGLMGSTQIDSTFTTGDNSPATASTQVFQAATFAKSFSPNAIPSGGTSTLTFTVSNPNATAITGLAFSDTFPVAPGAMTVAATPLATTSNCGSPTFSPVAGAGSIAFSNGSVAGNTICTITVNVTATAAGTYTNTSGAATSTETGSLGTATSQLTVTTKPGVVKSFTPDTIAVGGTSRLAITVTNNNTLALSNLAFSDPLPAGVTIAASANLATTCGGTTTVPPALTNGTISVTGGALAASGTCTIAVDVTAAAAGVYTNTASGASSTESGAAGPASPAQDLTVLLAPTIAKAFSPASVAVNERSRLTLTVTNPNALRALLNVAFTDPLPATITVPASPNLVTSGCGALATVTASGGTVSLASGRIASGGTCTIAVDVVGSTAGSYNNTTSTVTSDNGGASAAGASATLTVNNRPSIAKAFSPTVIPATGTPATWSTATFTVTNNAASAITATTFTDPLPSGLVVAPTPTATTTCTSGTVQTSLDGTTWRVATAGDAFVRLTGASLNAGASCTVSIRLTSASAGAYANTTGGVTSSINATPGNPSNTATVTVVNPAVTMTKGFNPSTVSVNGTTQLTLTITNPNTAAISGIAVQDTFPTTPGAMTLSTTTVANTCGGTVESSANGTTWTAPAVGGIAFRITGASVAANTSCTVTVQVKANTAGTYNNVTNAVTAVVGGFTYTGNTAGAVLTVNTAPSIAKTFSPSSVAAGTNAQVNFVVTNGNAAAATALTFTDVFPTSPGAMTYASTVSNTCGGTLADSSGGSLGAGDVGIQLTGGSIAANGTCTVSITVAAATPGTYSNQTSTVTASTGTGAASNTAVLTVVAPPSIAKAFGASSIALNGTTTLTLTLSNPSTNSATLTGLAVTDALPAGLQVAATPAFSNTCGGSVSPGQTAGDTTITLSGAALAPGATCAVTVNVTGTTAGSKVNTTGAVTSTNGGSGNTATSTVNVVSPPVVAKAFGAATVGVNNTVGLTITITNPAANAVALTGVSLNDTLPAGLQVASVPGLANTCGGVITSGGVPGDTFIGLAGGTVAAGGSCTIQVTLLATTTGTKSNTTQNVQSANGGTGNTASASVDVLSLLTAAKAFNPTSIGAGGASQVTITLTNPNTAAVTGIAFTDTFPVAPGAMTLFDTTTSNTCGGTLADSGGGALNAGDVGVRLTGVTLAAGASCTVTFNVTASALGTYSNSTGPITSTTLGTTPAASGSLEVRARPTVTKSFGTSPIGAGQSSTLTLAFGNANAANLTGLAFTDVFPAAPGAMTYVGTVSNTCGGTLTDSGAGALAAGDVGIALTGGTIPPAGCSIVVTVTATTPGDYTNTMAIGSVSTTEAGTNAAASSATLTVGQASLAKSFVGGPIDAGGSVTLRFTLANATGNPAQSGIAFSETLPASLRFTSATPTVTFGAGCAGTTAFSGAPTNKVDFTAVSMAAATASCTIDIAGVTNVTGQVNASCAGNPAAFTNQSANVTGLVRVANGVSPQCLVVNAIPVLTKAFGTATIGLGQATTLAFTLDNSAAGAAARAGLAFADALPAGLVVANPPAATTSAGCVAPTLTGTADGSTSAGVSSVGVAAGNICVVTFTVRGATVGAKVNDATAISGLAGLTNGITPQTVTVVQASAAKTFGAGTIADGAATTLVFTLANGAGNPAQGGIALSDTLPLNLRFTSATPAVAYSAGCSGPAAAAYNSGTRVLSGLTGIAMSGGTASCTVTVAGLTNVATQVNASCPSANFTNAAASVTTTNATNASTDQCLVVTTAAPTLAKTFGAATIADGAATTLVFTLTNSGTSPAQSGLAVSDTLPTGLALNSATPAVAYSAGCSGPATAAYNSGTRVLSGLTGLAMAAGTASCTVTVSGLTNQATQTNATCPGTAAFTNTTAAITTTGVTVGGSDQCLLVTKAVPTVAKTFGAATIADNGTTTLVFTFTNTGTNPAQSGITVGDTLPTGLRFNSATPAVAYSAGCSGPATAAYNSGTRVLSGLTGLAMSSGTASCTVTIAGLTNAATQTNGTCPGTVAFTNTTAAITATGATVGGADACLLVTAATPTLTKSFTTPIDAGGTSTLTFTIANSGSSPAQSGIGFVDTYPPGVATAATPAIQSNCPAGGAFANNPAFVSSAAGSVTVTGAALNAGVATCQVRIDVTAATAGSYTNTAAGNISGAANVNAAGLTATLVVQPVPTIAKAFGAASLGLGQATTLAFTIDNTAAGAVNRAGLAFADLLPAGLATQNPPAATTSAGCLAPTLSGTANGSTSVGATAVTVNAGTTCVITFTLAASTTGAKTNNAASITSSTGLVNAITPQTVTVVQASAAKTFGAASIADTTTTTLVFTLTNGAGNPAQGGIALGDTLPLNLRFNSATPAVAYSAGCSGPATAAYNGGTRVLSGLTGLTMAGGTASCTVTVSGLTNVAGQVNASCPAANFTNAAASVTTTNATNTSTDQCLVVTAAQPTVAKTFGAAAINDGASTTLVFTLTNAGSNPAQSGIALSDTLPTGLAIGSATPAVAYSAGCSGPATAAYNSGTRVLSGLTGLAMANGTASCTVTVSGVTNQPTQLNAACPGTAAFTNTAAAITATAATVGGGDACLLVNRIAPTVAKTFAAGTIADGAATSLVFTLTNAGTNPAQPGLAISDTLPTGLAINSATPAVAYSAGCSGPATAAYNSGTRVLSGLTGVAMASGTASCTVTVAGLTNQATQTNATCPGTAAFTNTTAAITTTGLTVGGSDQCLLVTKAQPTVAKTFGAATIADAATTTLVFTLTNSGTSPAQSGLAISDTLPTGLAINSATPAVAYSAGCSGPATAAYNSGTRVLSGLTGLAMTAGTASCTVTVAGLTNQATQTNAVCPGTVAFTNTTAAIATTGVTVGGSDQCLLVTAGTPTVSKAFGAATIADGATTTLVFTLANGGSGPAQSGITLSDTLPTGLRLNAATPALAYSAGCSGPATAAYNAGTRVLSAVGPIAMASGTASCTVTVAGLTNAATQVNAVCPGTAAFTNTAAAIGATGATAGGADACLLVTRGTPTLAKAFSPATIAQGGISTLVFTITNSGTAPAQSGIGFLETLPTNVTVAGAPTVQSNCPAGGALANNPAFVTTGAGTITVAAAAMNAGVASCEVRVNVTSATIGTYNNTAAGNISGAANVDATGLSATLTVQALPTLTKAFGASALGAGQQVTLAFTIDNTAASAVNRTGLAFADLLPAGLVTANPPAATTSAGCLSPTLAGTADGSTSVGVTSVNVNAGTTCVVTFTLRATALGAQVNNAASITSSTGLANAITPQTVTVVQASAAKTFGAATIADAASTTLVFTLANGAGNPAQSGIALGDTLPASLRFLSATPAVAYSAGCSGPATAAYNGGTRVLSGLTGIAMANGTASCTVTVAGLTNAAGQVNGTCPGTAAFTNLAASVTTTNAANGSADQCLLVTAGTPTVAKTFGAATIADGAATTLVFTFTNTGSNPAQSGLAVSDTLPTGLRFGSATPAVAYSAGCSGPATAAYNGGTRVLSGLTGLAIANGTASCTVTVAGLTNAATQVNAVCPGTAAFTNATAAIAATGATVGGTDQCLLVTRGTPTLAKAFTPATINAGGTSTLVFTITNTGTLPAQSGIGFTDTLPANVSVAGTPNVQSNCPAGGALAGSPAFVGTTASTITVTGAAVNAGVASCEVRVNVTASAAGSYANTAAANISGSANVDATGLASTLTVQGLPTLTKAFGATSVGLGQNVTLAFTIDNTVAGSVNRTALSFTDLLPAGLATANPPAATTSAGCLSPTLTGTADASTSVGASSVDVNAGTTCVVTFTLRATALGAQVNNAASITASSGLTNAITPQTVTVVQPSVAKTFGAASIADAATTTLVFTLTNGAGNPAQGGIALSDTLPASLKFASATPAVAYSAGCSGPATAAYNGGTRVLSGLTGLAMTGGTASCTVTVAGVTNEAGQVNASCPAAAFTNLAANVTTTRATNTSTDQCLLVGTAAPTVAKTFGAATIADGASTSLVFTFTNTGSNPAQSGLAVSDTLPTGLRFASATPAVAYSAGCSGPATAAFNSGTRVLSGLTGLAMANGTASCSVTVAGLTNAATQVNATCPGTAAFTNTTAAIGATGATVGGTDQCLLVTRGTPTLAKAFSPATIAQGGTSTVVFTIANSGTAPAQSGIGFLETLPTNVTVAGAPTVQSNCPAGGALAASPAFVTATAGAGTITVANAAMNAGVASCEVRVNVTANTVGTYNNTAAGNISGTANVDATGLSATLTVQALPTLTKAFGASALGIGQPTTLAFTLDNTAPSAVNRSAISFTDLLPAGLVTANPPAATTSAGCVSPTLTGTADASTSVGASSVGVNAGTTCVITFTLRATALGAQVNNAASITASSGLVNAVTPQTVTVVQPSVAKTFGAASIADAATTTLVFTLANGAGNPAQGGIALSDTLPAALRFTSATPAVAYSAGCSGPATAAYNSGTRVLSGLTGIAMAAGTASCTVTVSGVSNATGLVNATCPGTASFTNAASAVTATNATNASTDQCLLVTAGTPTVAKTFGAATIADGGSTTLVFTFTNTGSNPAQSGLAVSDTLPSGLRFASATPAVAYAGGCSGPASAAYNSGTRVLSGLTGLAMANGTASCTVTVAGLTNEPTLVNATCPGAAAFTNTTGAISATGATVGGASACLLVTSGTPTLAKAFLPATINAGGTSTLTFTIANTGSSPAQAGIGFTDTLPTNVAVAGTPNVQSNCPSGGAFAASPAFVSTAPGSITVSGAALGAGVASCQVRVDVTASIAGSYANTAAGNITGSANVDATGLASTLTVQSLPTLAKAFGAASVGIGQNVTLAFTIDNSAAGSVNRAGLAFADLLPAGLVTANPPVATTSAGCVSPTLTGTADASTSVGASSVGVNAGNTCVVTFTLRATALGAQVNNAASITSSTGLVNAVTPQTVTVVQPSVAKTFGAAGIVDAGSTTLVFTLANGAGNPAQGGIALGDTLPASLRFLSATPAVAYSVGCAGPASAAYNSGTRVLSGLTGISMGAGTASCTVTVSGVSNVAGQLNASCPSANFTNAASAVTTTRATNTSTDQCLLVGVTLPTVSKAFGAASIADGATTTMAFTLANTGSNPAQSGIALSDTLPTGLRFNSATPAVAYSAGCSGPATAAFNSGTRVLSGLTGLAMANGTVSCTVTLSGLTNAATQVNATCPGNAAFTNTTAAITATGASVTGTDACLLVNRGTPTLAKAFSPTTIDAGGTATAIFTITNSGTAPAQSGIGFADTLPANLAVAGSPNLQSNCPAGGALVNNPAFLSTTASSITVSGAAMNAGVASCEVRVNVTSTLAGSYTNAAGNLAGLANVDATGLTATLTVQPGPLLTKAFGTTAIGLGSTTTLAFTIDNTAAGAVNRAGLSFSDALPAGLAVANPPAATTSAGCVAPTLTGTANGSTAAGASSIGVNAGNTCVVTFTVRGTAAGTQSNTAASVTVGGGLGNGVTTQVVDVVSASLSKAFGTSAINDTGLTTLVFTLTNGGAAPSQSGIGFTETLPASLRFSTATLPIAYSAGCSGPATATATGSPLAQVVLSGLAMAAGTATCTVTIGDGTTNGVTNVAGQTNGSCAATPAAFTNQSSNVTGLANVASGIAPQCLVVGTPPQITKAFGASSIGLGLTTTLTFTIQNTGPGAVARSALAFTDTLPAGLVVANPPAPTASGCGAPTFTAVDGTQPFTASGIAIAAGGTCTITTTVRGATTGTKVNGAGQVSVTGLANGVTDQTLTVGQASLDKAFSPTAINVGGTSTLVFTIANAAGTPAQAGLGFTDTLPGSVRVAAAPNVSTNCPAGGGIFAAPAFTVNAGAGSASVAVTGATLSAGVASCEVRVDVTSASAGSFTNDASRISGLANIGNAVNPSTLVVSLTPTIAKAFAGTIASGGVTTLTVTVGNGNASAITVNSVTDSFPTSPGAGLVRAATPNASTTCAGGVVSTAAGSVTLTGGTVPAGGSCTFQVDVTAATAGSYVNTIPAGALSTSVGTNAAPASATLTVTPLADLSIVKTGPATVNTGAAIAYSITISNAGPDAANGATFADAVPSAITGVGATCTASGGAVCGAMNVAANNVTSTVTALPAGGAVTLNILGTVQGLGTLSNSATVTAPAGVPDPNAANNTAGPVTTTILAPDLTITKTHAGSFTVGTNGTYTLTVSNAAGSLATSGTITVADTLPAGLSFVSATGSGWACGFAAGTVTCTTGAVLAAGNSAPPISLVVGVASTAVPSVLNFASVSGGGEPAGATGNNTASDNTIVVAAGVATFAPDNALTVPPGGVAFYTHTFTAATAGTVQFSTSAVLTPVVAGWTQAIFRDSDCNGTLNGAESATPLTAAVAVAAGDIVCIVVRDSVPASAPYNSKAVITVTALVNGTQSLTRTDVTTVGAAGGAGLTLAKSVRNVTQGGAASTANAARPNDVLEYTVTYTNTTAGLISSIVITDATPAFTLYQAAACGAPLPGSITSCTVTQQPAVNGVGSVVWTLGGSLLSGNSGTVSFTVRVAP